MSHILSTTDLARYEEVSRIMLSPLAAPSVDAWRLDLNRAIGSLFGVDATVSMVAGGERLFLSEENPHLAAGVESYVAAYTTDGIYLRDAVVDHWNRQRRASGQDVFSWSINEKMIGRDGYRMTDSEIVSDVLIANKIHDFVGMYARTHLGEALLWLLFKEQGGIRHGEGALLLLRALLPSFKAGIEALARLDAQRHALDLMAEPVLVFGIGRREIHRNQAMMDLLHDDPERDLITDEMRRMEFELYPLGIGKFGLNGTVGSSPALREITTKRSRYQLRGTILPPGSFGPDMSFMIFATRRGGAQLPGQEVLRERYGLTSREAEVALLLAEGLSNDDIAERLFLSPHTARRHTANIFGKLEVSSRKALALKFLGA